MLEFSKSNGKQVRAGVRQSVPQLGEALRHQEQLPDDQQRPPLPDNVESPSHPT
jgi:hypothetical protein